MVLDVVCLLVIVFSTVTGYRAGLLRQVLLVACLVGSLFVSYYAVDFVGKLFSSQPFMWLIGFYVCSCFLGWLLAYIFLRFVVYGISRFVRRGRGDRVKPWDRKWGAVLGAAKGGALVFVILCGLDVALGVSKPHEGSGMFAMLARTYAESHFGSAISRMNPVGRWRAADQISVLIEVARNPAVLKGIEKEEEIRALVINPKIVALAKSRAFEKAWEKKDFSAIAGNKEFRELLSDKDVLKPLRDIGKALDVFHARVEKAKASP